MSTATYMSLVKKLRDAPDGAAYLLNFPTELLGPVKVIQSDGKPSANPRHEHHAKVLAYIDRNGKVPAPQALPAIVGDASSSPVEDAMDIRELRDRLADIAAREEYAAVVIPTNLAMQAGAVSPKEIGDQFALLASTLDLIETKRKGNDKPVKASDLAEKVVERLRTGITTALLFLFPWPTLDAWARGCLRAGNVGAFLGRPGRGKSWLIFLIAWLNAVTRPNINIVLITREMESEELIERGLAMISKLNLGAIHGGQLGADDWETLNSFKGGMPPNLIILDDDEIEGYSFSKVKAAVKRYEPGLLLVDAAYMVDPLLPAANRWSPEREKFTKLMQQFKSLARSEKIPILLTWQLNRKADDERREKYKKDKGFKKKQDENADQVEDKPVSEVAHAFGSDAIGQYLSLIVAIEDTKVKDERFLAVVKNRHGPEGHFKIKFRMNPIVLDELRPDADNEADGADLIGKMMEDSF